MPLQQDVINTLKPYCVETTMVWLRSWTPEWTFNDFAEALSEYIREKKSTLSDQQLQSLIFSLIALLKPYPECTDFINKLTPFVAADTQPNPTDLLNITRKYREKFTFIPPTDSASLVTMSYGDKQEKYMSLMMNTLDACAARLNALNPDTLTFEIFLQELSFLAQERQNVAHKCGHSNADDFGAPRWDKSDRLECTTTRLSASNYKGLKEKCLARRNRDQNFDIDKISQENLSEAEKITLAQARRLSCTHYENYFLEIAGEKIPITHLAWDDKGSVFFLHTLPLYVMPILKETFPIWQKAMQPNIGAKALIEAMARIEYRLQHAMPWQRGSAAITSVFNYALLKKHGYEITPTQANTAIYWEALATRDEEAFVQMYAEIFAVHPTALLARNPTFQPALALAKLAELRHILSDVILHEAPEHSTPAYQAKIQPELFKLKQKIDDKDAAFDQNLEAEIQAYCQQHEASHYAQKLRAALHPCFDRQKALHRLVLWGTPAPKSLFTR